VEDRSVKAAQMTDYKRVRQKTTEEHVLEVALADAFGAATRERRAFVNFLFCHTQLRYITNEKLT
jgi:hypothetical protein